MATVRHQAIATKNEVTRRLSKGNGKIAGIKCCVSVDDLALVPVEVVGVDFSFGKHNGVMVRVRPFGGYGELVVSPTGLLDDTKEAHDLFRRKTLANQRYREVSDANSDRERRTKTLKIRDDMTDVQKKRFDALADDLFGEGKKMVESISKASGDWSLKRVAEKAAKILYDVDDLDREEYWD